MPGEPQRRLLFSQTYESHPEVFHGLPASSLVLVDVRTFLEPLRSLSSADQEVVLRFLLACAPTACVARELKDALGSAAASPEKSALQGCANP